MSLNKETKPNRVIIWIDKEFTKLKPEIEIVLCPLPVNDWLTIFFKAQLSRIAVFLLNRESSRKCPLLSVTRSFY